MQDEQDIESRQLALDAIPVGIILADARVEDQPIIYANPAFERLTGYSAEEVLGRNCRLLQGPDSDPAAIASIAEAMAEKRPFQGRILNYRKDGTPFWNELTVTPIRDGGSDIKYLVGVQVDITSRLQLEQSLREAQKMEAIGRLAGGIAHDFNNLLAVILGSAEALEEETDGDPEVAHCIADIVSAVGTGANLVERMLEFSRSNSTDVSLVDVNDLVRATVRLLERTIREPVRFECDLSNSVGRTTANKASLETAVINLVVNAFDAMPRGGVITIRTRRRLGVLPGFKEAAEISVGDSGCGMDLETRTRAFEPFYTTKGSGVGTGLGLSMVHNFVTQSGGQVRIESEEGSGTLVSLVLPGADDDEVQADTRAAGKVLLVEDSDLLRGRLARQLSSEGFKVEEASTAEEALELLRGKSYAFMITDIVLAGQLTGIELVRIAAAEGIRIPSILMTGYTSELASTIDEDSSLLVLRKPFRKAELLAAIQEARAIGA